MCNSHSPPSPFAKPLPLSHLPTVPICALIIKENDPFPTKHAFPSDPYPRLAFLGSLAAGFVGGRYGAVGVGAPATKGGGACAGLGTAALGGGGVVSVMRRGQEEGYAPCIRGSRLLRCLVLLFWRSLPGGFRRTNSLHCRLIDSSAREGVGVRKRRAYRHHSNLCFGGCGRRCGVVSRGLGKLVRGSYAKWG